MAGPSETAELKQQGAIEAAQEANSKAAADAAAKKVVTESKKAGVAAYEFDPDATPEQKARQAQNALPDGMARKTKAVEMATDIDDGAPPAYDLPPPSKDGLIAVKDGKAPQALIDDDKEIAEKVGWVPGFSALKSHDIETESLQDHATWLEGKIPEKFFGDWYHNAAIMVFACLSTWVLTVLGGGLTSVIIILAVCATYYRTSIRRVRRNFRDDINRELAMKSLEHDHETLEWINLFMVKLWPVLAPYISLTVIQSVDQVLSTTTPAFLDSLRLRVFTLGTKPPRLEFVKSYPKVEDDYVVMDWKFSFTPNDTADMTARQIKTKVNPKVILEVRIGKGLVSKGLDVIVEDMAMSGLMQVKIKLQKDMPFVEKVDISFLERPTIDYKCKPLGGETFGFDINFIPGLESFILEQIHANIGPIMYAPNSFPIEVAKILAGSAVDEAIGVVQVTLHGAQGVKNPDKFAGTPDPYATLALGGREELARTKIVKENANPKWNETKYIIVNNFNDPLTIKVFDFNEFRTDKNLGTATFNLADFETSEEFENVQLEILANGKPRGIVQADIRFFPTLEGRELPDGTKEPPPESNTGILKYSILRAKELDGDKSFIGALNPYAVLIVNNKEVQITKKLKRTNDPIWDNGTKEILITDRKKAALSLIIKDDRGIQGDPIIGSYSIKLDDLVDLTKKGQDWFRLANAKSGRAQLTALWKPVGLRGVIGGSTGYITPIGVMRFHFKNARGLRNLETMGKSDPYVRILLSGIEKARTVTFQNNLDPDFDEVQYVAVHTVKEKLTIEIMDQEKLGKDRSLGLFELAAADYVKQNDQGVYLPYDNKTELQTGLRMKGVGAPKGVLTYSVSFFPCLNVADPEDEEEKKAKESLDGRPPTSDGKKSGENSRPSTAVDSANKKQDDANAVDKKTEQILKDSVNQTRSSVDLKPPRVHLTPEELLKRSSGFIIFNLMDAELSHSNLTLEVLMDDFLFPAYISSRAKSRHHVFNEIGDAFVRELDVSKITLRLREKSKNAEDEDNIVAKLTGDTLLTLKNCLNNPSVLTIKDSDGGSSRVKISLKYIPVDMVLDPSESINNMGDLRVNVLDASDLPAADRSGLSDPYAKFFLNDKELFKTKVQKKTLNPAWNEFFETPVASRTAAKMIVKVYDWDFADSPDFLGEAPISLADLEPFQPKDLALKLNGKSGTIRLRLLFKPSYITRSRQGTSTFSGTFATPGRIVTGVAGAPIKGVGIVGGAVGGGVVKGASFLKHGFKSKKKGEDGIPESESGSGEEISSGPSRAATLQDSQTSAEGAALAAPVSTGNGGLSTHSRARSIASFKGDRESMAIDAGTATFTIVSASGFPADAHVRVTVNRIDPKGPKEIHETKAIKESSGQIQFASARETFKVLCTPAQQFQLVVKDHATFGRDKDLGETLVFVDDSGDGGDKEVKVGTSGGTVVLRSSFEPNQAANGNDAASTNSPRRSLTKRLRN